MDSFLNTFPFLGSFQFGWRDFLDVIIISFLLYRVILFVKHTRSLQIILGVLFLLCIYLFAQFFRVEAIYKVLQLFFGSLVLILVVIFQPEIRKMLIIKGRKSSYFKKSKLKDPYFLDRLLRAVEYFSTNQIGMIVAIERNTSIREYADSGTLLDSRVSAPLLVSLFNTASPLHDGAVLIDRDLRIYAAACILPLTSRINLTTKTGTRHRAAIGITEETDCLVVVVSEETGRISFFHDGKQEIVSLENFKSRLENYMFLGQRKST